MKKTVSILTTLVLSLVLIFSLGGCKEVENGSEIKRVTFEIEFTNADGTTETTTIEAKLYTTFASKTTAKIIDLIESGYYNDLCISNVASSYALFGNYKLNAEGKLEAVDGNISTVSGEFYNNGLSGNNLVVTDGALVLKRDAGYDSGKATIALCFSASAPFDADSYCVFGKLLSDDGDSSADSSALESLSSVQKAKKIADYLATENQTKVYYIVKDKDKENSLAGNYYTYFVNDGGIEYYEGIVAESDIQTGSKTPLNEDAADALKTKLASSDGSFEYYNLPVTQVIIKKAEVKK